MHTESLSRPLRLRWTERGAGWLAGAALIALAVLAPLLTLGWWALGGDLAHWQHLASYVLPQALANTLILLAGVGALVALLGTGSAWLVTAYEFPTRRTLTWALLLPLAVPTYIIAFAYLDLLHPIGPIQTGLRAILGYDSPRQFRLPDLRSIQGAIFVLGFVLYPYVYLSTRVMFMTQAASLLEAARSLGAGRAGVFFRVALPLARPAIVVGMSLALLETLNDIGASEFLGVQTLTVSVYTTWVTRSDLAGAAQIALTMLAIVVGLILLERHGRKRQRYANTQRMRPMQPRRLRGPAALVAAALGWIPVLLGFVAPALYLVVETYKRLHLVGGVSGQLLVGLRNTLTVAFCATVVTLLCGLTVAWAGRTLRKRRLQSRTRLRPHRQPGLRRARHGARHRAAHALRLDRHRRGPPVRRRRSMLMGSMGALVCAYAIRFLAISTGAIEAGLAHIPPSLEQASRMLGETSAGTLRRVHLPLLRRPWRPARCWCSWTP